MERIVNTLLPARMFVLCSAVCYGNGFVSSSNDDALRHAQGDDDNQLLLKMSFCVFF